MFFDDEVHAYQTFVREHFYLLGDQYQIIQEQYPVKHGLIDILAYNSERECLTIIELKNITISSDVLTQVMKYFNELKFKYIDNYSINNTPEIIVISPEFDKNFYVYKDMPIKLIQMYYDTDQNNIIYKDFIPRIEEFNAEFDSTSNFDLHKFSPLKLPRVVNKTLQQELIIKKIINQIKQLYTVEEDYTNSVNIIEVSNKIDIMFKKIIAKIIIPNKWFDDSLQLIIYKRFIKPFDLTTFNYDPNIKKIQWMKTYVKLTISDVPQFLKA